MRAEGWVGEDGKGEVCNVAGAESISVDILKCRYQSYDGNDLVVEGNRNMGISFV